jgi:hypothetical protein
LIGNRRLPSVRYLKAIALVFSTLSGSGSIVEPELAATATSTSRVTSGYWLVTAEARVFSFGSTGYEDRQSEPIAFVKGAVGMARTLTGHGYWVAASDGGVFSFGDARFHGSTGDGKLNRPVVGMAADVYGEGYWLAAGDGGVFNFGTAGYFGSAGDRPLNHPVVGIAAARSLRGGYWLVAADGGVFSFGDANFYGSTGAQRLNSPIVGMAATPSHEGYWLVAADGGVFAFGDATFAGSAVGRLQGTSLVGMSAAPFAAEPTRGILLRRAGDVFVFSEETALIGRVFFPPPPPNVGDVPLGADRRAALSPDGRWVIMQVRNTKYYVNSYVSVLRDPRAAQSEAPAANLGGFLPGSPSISADGRFVAMSRASNPVSNVASLYVLDTVGGEPRCIAECSTSQSARNIAGTTWAPDGRTISYGLRDGAGWQILTIGADGTNRALLTNGRDPRWSPDGSRIAYVLETGKDTSEIWTVTPSGTDPKLVATGGYNDQPVWSPHGNRLAYVTTASPTATDVMTLVTRPDGPPVPLTGRPGDWILDCR